MLLIEKADRYAKKRRRVLEVVADPNGFWVAMLTASVQKVSSFEVSIAAPSYGLVSVGPSLEIEDEGGAESGSPELFSFATADRLVWNAAGTRLALLLCNSIYFINIDWVDCVNGTEISSSQEAIFLATSATAYDCLLSEVLSTKLSVQSGCPRKGTTLKVFPPFPNFLFVIHEDSIHQLDWCGNLLKTIVTSNIQDRWLYRLGDDGPAAVPLNLVSIMESQHLASAKPSSAVAGSTQSENPDSLEDVDLNALDDSAGFADALTPSLKTRCIADVQCVNRFALLVSFCDGSISLYLEQGSNTPSSPVAPFKVCMSSRVHLVCQVAYPMLLLPGKAVPAGSKLLNEPQVYEKNRSGDYFADAVTLEEVLKYLRVNENVRTSHPSQTLPTAETATHDSVSISLFHKIARSISIVNGTSKEDIAEICTITVLPTSAAFHSNIPQTNSCIDAVALVRVRHISDDPRFDDLARYNAGAQSLHNIRVDSGVSYLVAKLQFTIHSHATAEIGCREAYKLFFSRNSPSHASVEMKVFGFQEHSSSSSPSTGMVAIVHDGVLSLRAMDSLDCVLNTVDLLPTSLPRICIATSRFILYGEQALPAQDSALIAVFPFSCQQRGSPNLWIDDSSGSLTHLVHKLSIGSSPAEPTDSNLCGAHKLASENRVEPLPKALHCALLVHRFLPLVAANSKFSPLTVLVAYRVLMALGKPSWSIDEYMASARNISQKADSQYFALVKNIDRQRLERTIASCLLPELFIFSVRTQKWKSLLLSIGSAHLLPKNASVKLVKTIPCMHYHSSGTSNGHASGSHYSFPELRNTNVSMWDIDVEAFKRTASLIESKDGAEGGPAKQLVPEENGVRSRSSSLASNSNSNGVGLREEAGVSGPKREHSNLSSLSAPINAKSQLSQHHLQVLELKWWDAHSLLLITLRKAQHFVEIISRDSLPFHHNFAPSTPQNSASHHNVGRVHRLMPLPVGFIPKLWAFREVHNVLEESMTPNVLNHYVVIVGNEKIFFAYLLATIVNEQREIIEYNVVELWNADLERVVHSVGDSHAVSMAEHLQNNGGAKKIEVFVQQAPILERQEAVFKSLGRHYSPMVLKSGTGLFVPYVALLVVDGAGAVTYVDIIHGVARSIESKTLAAASSKPCPSGLHWTAVESVHVASIHHFFHPHYSQLLAQDSEPSRVWNDAIILQRQPVDHVWRHKLLALQALSKFKLLSKYAKDPAISIFAMNETNFSIALQPCHPLLLLGWRLPAHSAISSKSSDHPVVSYMPSADKVDAWLHEHLGKKHGSALADSREALVVRAEWMPAVHSRKHLVFSQGLWLELQSCQVVASNCSYHLLAALFRFYARNVRAAAGLQEQYDSSPNDICISDLSGTSPLAVESYAVVDLLRQFIGRSMTMTGFSTKQLSHLLESLLLTHAHSPRLAGGDSAAAFDWHSNYMLLSSFLFSCSEDLYLVIISRVLRQTEPFISRRLFPVQLQAGSLLSLSLSSKSSRSASVTLFTVFEKALQKSLLLCSSLLLNPLCEALGGTESPVTIRVCTAICLEYLQRALHYVFVDSALQCLDFTERLLTILSALPYDESIHQLDLRRLQMDVAACTGKLKNATGTRPHATTASTMASTSSLEAVPASILSGPATPSESPDSTESGIVHGLRWLLGQFGVVVDGQAQHADNHDERAKPLSLANWRASEGQGRGDSDSPSICSALSCVQSELGEKLLADVLSSGARPNQPPPATSTSASAGVASKPRAGSASAPDFPRPSLQRGSSEFHMLHAQHVYAAHEPITNTPLRLTDRIGLLFGALLAHRLRSLLSDSKQPRYGSLHVMSPKEHVEVASHQVHPNGADHGSNAHPSRGSSTAIEAVSMQAETNGHVVHFSQLAVSSSSYTAVAPSPSNAQKAVSDGAASNFHHGSALLLILSICQSNRACKLVRRHLSIIVPPLLEKLLGPPSAHQQSVSDFDFAAYANQLSRGMCDALYLESGLMPLLTEDVSVLIPFWHILRLHKHLPQAAGASKPQHQLRPEMLKQALSAQYIYKLAQLEQKGYRTHMGAGKDESRPSTRPSSATMYYGLFQDDALGMPCDLPYTVDHVVRAIVTTFLLLKDPHIALCALYTLRNLFEDSVHDRILAVAKQLVRLHRFQSKLGAQGGNVDEALGEDADRGSSLATGKTSELPEAVSAGKEALGTKIEEIRKECLLAVEELLFRFVA